MQLPAPQSSPRPPRPLRIPLAPLPMTRPHHGGTIARIFAPARFRQSPHPRDFAILPRRDDLPPLPFAVSNSHSVYLAFGIARKPEICISACRLARPWSSGRRAREMVLASRRIQGSSDSGVPQSGKESLNFKVSPEFKKEFKGFAVSEGISMTELLKEGFALSKKLSKKKRRK